ENAIADVYQDNSDQLVVVVLSDLVRLAQRTSVVCDVPLIPNRPANLNMSRPDIRMGDSSHRLENSLQGGVRRNWVRYRSGPSVRPGKHRGGPGDFEAYLI